jgi:hypothetical protein
MRNGRLFVSYRRDDAAGYARALYDELVRCYSDERVFMDVDDIAPGVAFDEAIRRAVGEASVLLVLIGRRWAGPREGSSSRLHDPHDVVRHEIETGLALGLRVIPVLLDGTPMPREDELPESLRPLARRQAVALDHARYAADLARLRAALQAALGEPAPSPTAASGRWKRMLLLTAAGGLAAGLAVGVGHFFRPGEDQSRISGEWRADVTYDWPGAHHVERFLFSVEAGKLHGTASFLGLARGIVEGRAEANTLSFSTLTHEVVGHAPPVQRVHRYRGTLQGTEIRFVMQTEGGLSTHVPVEFIARRVLPAAAPASMAPP